MTPAQREIVHQEIQTSQAEITVIEMIQPMFDHLSQCPHCHSTHFKKWGKAKEVQRYYCKNCHKSFINKTKTPLAKLQ
jgi:transposase-like protein